jgi:hypothetical protein
LLTIESLGNNSRQQPHIILICKYNFNHVIDIDKYCHCCDNSISKFIDRDLSSCLCVGLLCVTFLPLSLELFYNFTCSLCFSILSCCVLLPSMKLHAASSLLEQKVSVTYVTSQLHVMNPYFSLHFLDFDFIFSNKMLIAFGPSPKTDLNYRTCVLKLIWSGCLKLIHRRPKTTH